MAHSRAGHGFEQRAVFAPQRLIVLKQIILLGKYQVEAFLFFQPFGHSGAEQLLCLVAPLIDELGVAAGLHLKEVELHRHNRHRPQLRAPPGIVRRGQRGAAGGGTAGQGKGHDHEGNSGPGHARIIA